MSSLLLTHSLLKYAISSLNYLHCFCQTLLPSIGICLLLLLLLIPIPQHVKNNYFFNVLVLMYKAQLFETI